MSEKRKTGAELRAEQEAREKANQDAAEAARQESFKKAREAVSAKAASDAASIKKSWYAAVQEAAKQDGIRFLVIAQVTGQPPAPVQELIQEIESDGYTTSLVNIPDLVMMRGKVAPRIIQASGAPGAGWWPGDVPTFGESGTAKHLIVTW